MKVEVELPLPSLLLALVVAAASACLLLRSPAVAVQSPSSVESSELTGVAVPVGAAQCPRVRLSASQSHLAVILDGNRRYARKANISYDDSYRKGAEVFKQSIEWCLDLHVRYYTVFAFSTENWTRDRVQVDTLMQLFEDYLRELSGKRREDINDKRTVEIRFIGRRDRFSPEIVEMMSDIERRSVESGEEPSLSVFVAVDYGGQWDIAQACLRLRDKSNVDEIIESFPSALSTSGAPPVDLLIRTGGNSRVSNFLLWQIAYSHIIVVEEAWPEITQSRLHELIQRYSVEPKNHGK